MVTIVVPPSSVAEIRGDIARIDARIVSLRDSIDFYTDLLNGAPEQLLYTPLEIERNPALAREQRVLVPAILGALDRDAVYQSLLFDQLQPIIDAYETERRALDGQFADFTIPGAFGPGSGLFDENLIQVSGKRRILPIFDPSVND